MSKNLYSMPVVYINKFKPNVNPVLEKIRAIWIGLKIRRYIKSGFVVFIVGGVASGKSFLLQNAFAHTTVKRDSVIREKNLIHVDLMKIKPGVVAVDDVTDFSKGSIHAQKSTLNERGVVFTVRNMQEIEDYDLNDFNYKTAIFYLDDENYILPFEKERLLSFSDAYSKRKVKDKKSRC